MSVMQRMEEKLSKVAGWLMIPLWLVCFGFIACNILALFSSARFYMAGYFKDAPDVVVVSFMPSEGLLAFTALYMVYCCYSFWRLDKSKIAKRFYGVVLPMTGVQYINYLFYSTFPVATTFSANVSFVACVSLAISLFFEERDKKLYVPIDGLLKAASGATGIWGGVIFLFLFVSSMFWFFSFVCGLFLLILISAFDARVAQLLAIIGWAFMSPGYALFFAGGYFLLLASCAIHIKAFWVSFRRTTSLQMIVRGLCVVIVFSLWGHYFAVSSVSPFDKFEALEKNNLSSAEKKEFVEKEYEYRQELKKVNSFERGWSAEYDEENNPSIRGQFFYNIKLSIFSFAKISDILIRPFLAARNYYDEDRARYYNFMYFDMGQYKEKGMPCEKTVFIFKQDINISEKNGSSEVMVHESYYGNPSEYDSDAVYVFKLPTGSVITGAWVGQTDDVTQRLPLQIKMRERGLFETSSDPNTLKDLVTLEQVDEQGYALNLPWPKSAIKQDARQPLGHFWLTYQVMNATLAKDAEIQPIFVGGCYFSWDKDTVHTLNGQVVTLAPDQWMPVLHPVVTTDHVSAVVGGYRVTASPLSSTSNEKQPVAVLVDTSFSMNKHQDELKQNLDALLAAPDLAVDLYARPNPNMAMAYQETREALQQIVPIGSENMLDMWNEARRIQTNKKYRAIVILTDGNAHLYPDDRKGKNDPQYDLFDSTFEPSQVPILSVQKNTISVIQFRRNMQVSKGDIVPNAELAIKQIREQRVAPADAYVAGGLAWQVQPIKAATSQPSTEKGSPLAARMIARYMEEHMPDKSGLWLCELNIDAARKEAQICEKSRDTAKVRDQIFAIGREYGIVTPYSFLTR